jgi:hypothetical protein
MKIGDSIRVKKQQPNQHAVDYLKSRDIKPLTIGEVVSVYKSADGIVSYMINFGSCNKTIFLLEESIEHLGGSNLKDMFMSYGATEDTANIFNDIFNFKDKNNKKG